MTEEDDADQEDTSAPSFPVNRRASPGQALVAIAFVFFLGVALGFLLARTF
ncbi:MAG: hypothetical protein JO086_17110 [Acidimicrobiia bacterium]|nr:hypothetical protein [Acidimicrobiia bacterium]